MKLIGCERIFAIAAASCSILVALLHVYVVIQGPWAYRYFGAGEELASLAEQGSLLPGILTFGIALLFFVFALYYVAAIKLFFKVKVPFLKLGLIVIAAVYTIRGVVIFPALLIATKLSAFDLWSSLVSLAIGLLHCVSAWCIIKLRR